MTLLIGAEVLAEKVAAAGKDIRKAWLARSGEGTAATHDKGMPRMRGLPMKAVLLTGLILFLIPALRAQQSECDTITLAEGQSINLQRACKLFLDLSSYHLLGSSRPGTHFHILGRLDCSGKAFVAKDKGQVVGCADRSKAHTDIYLLSDDPKVYLPIMAMALDYANQSYLEPGEIAAQCRRVLDEYNDPSLREKNHAIVSIKELGNKLNK